MLSLLSISTFSTSNRNSKDSVGEIGKCWQKALQQEKATHRHLLVPRVPCKVVLLAKNEGGFMRAAGSV